MLYNSAITMYGLLILYLEGVRKDSFPYLFLRLVFLFDFNSLFLKFVIMPIKERLTIIYTIIIVLSVMYATQPLQPLLSKEFNVSMVHASYFTAVIMFFLAIAPIFYGYILERTHAKKVLMSASVILFITNILLSFANTYEMFLFARIVEAMVIPAILTSSMALLASDKTNIKLNMSIYVAATVFGGLLGRLISGYIATEFGWRAVFLSISLALLFGLFLVRNLTLDVESSMTKVKVSDVFDILKDKRFIVIYFLMFSMFFVFAGVLNILPFRVKEQFPDIKESGIGLLYLGYGVGVIVSLWIHKIVEFFKKELRAVIFGIIVFLSSLFIFFSESFYSLFGSVFILCLGMFTVHTLSTRIANSLKEDKKALTSGMYLSFYYIGGTMGSIIPPIIYNNLGWDITILFFVVFIFFVGINVHQNRRLFRDFN